METKHLKLDDYFKSLDLDELKNVRHVITETQIPNLTICVENYKQYIEQLKLIGDNPLAERTFREMLNARDALANLRVLLSKIDYFIGLREYDAFQEGCSE